jgi:hypothetical protein
MNPHRPVLALAALGLLAVLPARAALTQDKACAEEGATVYVGKQLHAQLGSALPRFLAPAVLPQRMLRVGLEQAGYAVIGLEPTRGEAGCFDAAYDGRSGGRARRFHRFEAKTVDSQDGKSCVEVAEAAIDAAMALGHLRIVLASIKQSDKKECAFVAYGVPTPSQVPGNLMVEPRP